MSFVLFVPGLNGHKSIATQFSPGEHPGSNSDAVKQEAKKQGAFFMRSIFQTSSNPFPTLSQMGKQVAAQLSHLQVRNERTEAGLVVASSVGAGVTLQALSMLGPDRPIPDMIFYKPVIDPLHSIEMQMATVPDGQGTIALQNLKEGKVEAIHLPVEATHASPDPGHFMLTKAHIDDADALRLVSDETCFSQFAHKLGGRRLGSIHFLLGQQDIVPPQNIVDFANAARGHARDRITFEFLPGNHASDNTARLAEVVEKRLSLMPK